MGTELVLEQPAAMERRETAADVLAAQAKALVQARYLVAINRPRDMDQVREKLLKECARPTFAAAAIYTKPQGNSRVTGLSVRFAEAAQRALTNVLPERVAVYDDPEKRIVRVSMTDLESNVCHTKDLILEKRVERRDRAGRTVISQRINSNGQTVFLVAATEDELLTKEGAMSAKIERQLTLKLLDGDIQDECIAQVRATLERQDKSDPNAARKQLIDAFGAKGIRVADLKAYLGTDNLDALQPADLKELREVFVAVRDGEVSWRELLEQREAARGKAPDAAGEESKGSQALADKLKQRKAE